MCRCVGVQIDGCVSGFLFFFLSVSCSKAFLLTPGTVDSDLHEDYRKDYHIRRREGSLKELTENSAISWMS